MLSLFFFSLRMISVECCISGPRLFGVKEKVDHPPLCRTHTHTHTREAAAAA